MRASLIISPGDDAKRPVCQFPLGSGAIRERGQLETNHASSPGTCTRAVLIARSRTVALSGARVSKGGMWRWRQPFRATMCSGRRRRNILFAERDASRDQ